MARTPNLPFLPGLTFNPNIGRTNYRIDPKFDFNQGVPCLTEKVKPNLFGPLTDKYPSVYARGEVIEVPPWIAYDKQILCFDAFFKQTLQEVKNASFSVRNVKIYYFLEDGTVMVMEPPQNNSGITQGCLISRQRIRLPPPMDENFYDVLDFNVGREVEMFGKYFKITNCDKFTRYFLNRSGISVPDPVNTPADPYLSDRKVALSQTLAKKPVKKVNTFKKFVENDRKILRFYGYWDDRNTEFGEIHDLLIYYFLADDTMEIKDIVPPNAGREGSSILMKRRKLPKVYKGLPDPGINTPQTVLNVLGVGLNTRYVVDILDYGKEHVEYYKDNDLSIGGILNFFGRKIVLRDADPFTKEYYRATYGISSFVPLPRPVDVTQTIVANNKNRELPPWNGFGSYEDSEQNCTTVLLKPPLKDFKKFLKYDRVGMDSRVLRYEARLVSKIPQHCERKFVINFYLADDTIHITEMPKESENYGKKKFLSRSEIFMPGQELYQSNKPAIYQSKHLFIGAQVVMNSYRFVLVNADEYALRYMELHPEMFPKSDIKLIMSKLREKLRPIYKDFVGEMIPTENKSISYEKLRSKLCPLMGDDFTEHEMITISRAFSLDCRLPALHYEQIRAITLTELTKKLWNDCDRLKEYCLLRDPLKTGTISTNDAYTVLRGCRVPLDVLLMEKILDVIPKDENGRICYLNLIDFFNHDKCPLTYVIPLNIKSVIWWANEKEIDHGKLIDWCEFNKTLDLENTFSQKPKPYNAILGLEESNE